MELLNKYIFNVAIYMRYHFEQFGKTVHAEKLQQMVNYMNTLEGALLELMTMVGVDKEKVATIEYDENGKVYHIYDKNKKHVGMFKDARLYLDDYIEEHRDHVDAMKYAFEGVKMALENAHIDAENGIIRIGIDPALADKISRVQYGCEKSKPL